MTRGGCLLDLYEFHIPDLTEVAGRVAEIQREWEASKINVDEDGLGAGVLDDLRRMKREGLSALKKCTIGGVRSGAPASDRQLYSNVRAELWASAKRGLERGNLDFTRISGTRLCDKLVAQLASPRYSLASGRLKIESKEEMRRRGVASPDLADALLYALGPLWRVPLTGGAKGEPRIRFLRFGKPKPSNISYWFS